MERSDPDRSDMGGRTTDASDAAELLTPGEVAKLFGVDPKTVSRWADAGRLRALRTLGGHRRYRAAEVRSLLRSERNGDG